MKKLLTILAFAIYTFKGTAQNVGIGTTTPFDKLSVVTTVQGYGFTHAFGSVKLGSYLTPTTGQFGTRTNHPLQFFTNNGSAQMSLQTNGDVILGLIGKVGIGTTTPDLGLDIDTRIKLGAEYYLEGVDHAPAFTTENVVTVTPNKPLIVLRLLDIVSQRVVNLLPGVEGEVLLLHTTKGNLVIKDAGFEVAPGGPLSIIKIKTGVQKTLFASSNIYLVFINNLWCEI